MIARSFHNAKEIELKLYKLKGVNRPRRKVGLSSNVLNVLVACSLPTARLPTIYVYKN